MKKDYLLYIGVGAVIFIGFQLWETFFPEEGTKTTTAADPYREGIMNFCPEHYEQFSNLLRPAQKNEASGDGYPFDTYSQGSIDLYKKMSKRFIETGICPDRLPAADAPDGEKRLLAENVEKVKQLCPGAVEDFGYILESQIDNLYEKESAVLFFDIVRSYHLNGFCIKDIVEDKKKRNEDTDSLIIAPDLKDKNNEYDNEKIRRVQEDVAKKEAERLQREAARKRAQEAFERSQQEQ